MMRGYNINMFRYAKHLHLNRLR